MKRYFIVFYRATVGVNGVCTGHMEFTCHDGYLNKKLTLEQILEKARPENILLRDPVITNIIELGEADFATWTT